MSVSMLVSVSPSLASWTVTPTSARRCRIQVKTASCVSRSIKRRVREMVEWSGGASGNTKPRNSRNANESAARHAIARSASKPSK